MGFNFGNALAAVPDVHTRACLQKLGLAMNGQSGTLSTLVRNNESTSELTAGLGLTGGGQLNSETSVNFAVGAGTGILVTADAVSINTAVVVTHSGTGTTNTLPKWTNGAGGVLGNSRVTDDGVSVTVGSADGATRYGAVLAVYGGTPSGGIEAEAGSAISGNTAGGNVDFTAGAGFGSGNGGFVEFEAGTSGATGVGGSISFVAGTSIGSGLPGNASFYGGTATAGNVNGGYVEFVGGQKSGAGVNGLVRFKDATTGLSALFDTQYLANSRTFAFPNLVGATGYLMTHNTGGAATGVVPQRSADGFGIFEDSPISNLGGILSIATADLRSFDSLGWQGRFGATSVECLHINYDPISEVTTFQVIGSAATNPFVFTGNTRVTGNFSATGTISGSNLSASGGGNPSATVGTSAINGTSISFMRADGAPAINLGMIPTWTGVHTYSAQSVHNAGLSLGTSGVLTSAEVDGGGQAAFVLDVSVARTTDAYIQLRNSASAISYMIGSGKGEFSFGYGATSQQGNVLAFNVNDLGSIPTGNWTRGITSVVGHSNSGTAPNATMVAILGGIQVFSGATAGVTEIVGLAGINYHDEDVGTLAGKQMAGVYGGFRPATNTSPFPFPGAHANRLVAGNWARVASVHGGYFNLRPAIAAPFNLPSIITGVYAAIPAPTRGEAWGVETDAPTDGRLFDGSVAGEIPAVSGAIKLVFPVRGTRQAHSYWVPKANTAAIRANAAEGDVYFDDNTNFTGGLWEYSGAAAGANAWNYLLSSPGIVANGAVPAVLGFVGAVGGPAVAAQATWVQVNCADNIIRWIPAWV